MSAIARYALALLVFALAVRPAAGGAPGTVADEPPGGAAIALTQDGGSWSISSSGLARRSAVGEVLTVVHAAEVGVDDWVELAVSPHDDSAWVITRGHDLVHVGSNGTIDGRVSLPTAPASIAIAQDGTIWLLAGDRLLHYRFDGREMDSPPLASDAERPLPAEDENGSRPDDDAPASREADASPRWSRLLVDSLRDRLWIVEANRLTRQVAGESDPRRRITIPLSCVAHAAALDPLRGHVFVLCEDAITMIDGDGAMISRLDLASGLTGALKRIIHDTVADELVASGPSAAIRIATGSGLALVGSMNPAVAAVEPAPFRVAPSVSLLRPPDGGATYDPGQEIVLAIGARCPERECPVPASYIEGLRLDIELNGVPVTPAAIDAVSRRATLGRDATLRTGLNTMAAQVIDRFGHHATMPAATLTLLERAPSSQNVEPAESAAAAGGATTAADARVTSVDAIGEAKRVPKASNKLPLVALTSPDSGTTFTSGNAISLSASASDPDGSITKVEFYRAGSVLLGTTTSAPYTFAWSGAALGSHSLTAKAYDNRKGKTTSAAITITVVANHPPTIVLTAPADGSYHPPGGTVTLIADAHDIEGAVASVEFFDGDTLLAMITTAPWSWTWADATPGRHAITARATDAWGATMTTGTAIVTIGATPLVVIAAPAACTLVDAPIDLTIVADVYSASGLIVDVEIFDGSTLVAHTGVPPWRFALAMATA
ncbi:MAG: Ig-like domain-containing protein, partial [Casimicrobiaceae bacterium]